MDGGIESLKAPLVMEHCRPADSDVRPAITDMDITVDAGTVVGVQANRATGTILMQLASGDTDPVAGKVHLCGHDLSTMDRRERDQLRLSAVGVIHGDPQLDPGLTVGANLERDLLLQGYKRKEAAAAVEDAVATTPIRGILDDTPAVLIPDDLPWISVVRAFLVPRDLYLVCSDVVADRRANVEMMLALLRHHVHGTRSAVLWTTMSSPLVCEADRSYMMSRGVLVDLDEGSPAKMPHVS